MTTPQTPTPSEEITAIAWHQTKRSIRCRIQYHQRNTWDAIKDLFSLAMLPVALLLTPVWYLVRVIQYRRMKAEWGPADWQRFVRNHKEQ